MCFPSDSPRRFALDLAVVLFLIAAMPAPRAVAQAPQQASGRALEVTSIPLPGSPGRVGMDYLAFDPATSRVWVPAGNSGRVDVVDTAKLSVTPIEGFPIATRGERVVGPSSATVGAGFVYVGNRADSKVCAINAQTLKVAGCATLESSPDGVAFVAASKEVWVTTPRDTSLTILDVSTPAAPARKAVIHLDGAPEGYAVDAARGRFFTNLEDKDVTLVFDVRTRKEIARFHPGCGKEGPRGLALDADRQLVVVACTDKVVSLRDDQAGKQAGKKVGELATGGGVDNIDYSRSRHFVYVASGKTATLTIATLQKDGTLALAATAPTAPGSRVVVVDGAGRAFVADSAGGRLLLIQPAMTTLSK